MSGCGKISNGVTINDGFFNRFRETLIREGIPYQWEALNDRLPADTEPSYCIRNFRIAAGKEEGSHGGFVFQDSDVYKWLEGVAFSLRWHPDPALEATADEAISIIAEAQQPDGYLDTYYIINGLEKRWTNLKDHHELYCAGHMIEAAVAYYMVTGKRRLLDVALRFVDHIDSVIGPEEGKLHGYPGHPVIEMALMRLYEVTKDPRHLHLAEYFVNERGQSPLFFEEEDRRTGNNFYWKNSPFRYQYYQAGKPVRAQKDAEGHSVRAMYLFSGMADVARETGDESLITACRNLWESTTKRRMYITGAVGSTEYGEAFSFDYDLPNDTIYGETCASIGLCFFARRMLMLEARGEYADVMERALYNGILSGMQLDGKRFFYVNPLEVVPEACEKDPHKRHVKPERQKWFGCACCPPNLIRMLASLEDYIATETADTLYIHLYIGGEIKSGDAVLTLTGNYPWDGKIQLEFRTERPICKTIALRIPGWCHSCTIMVNDMAATEKPRDGYVYIPRIWGDGDRIDLCLDMPVRMMRANPRIRKDAGLVTLCRGPIVYCLEEADNGGDLHLLHGLSLAHARVQWEPETLGGVMTLITEAERESRLGWDNLYDDCPAPASTPVQLRWIPYYAWANRSVGEMRVWIRQ
ncbi:MAG: glycoside hydrolase family 127 protein [Clostridia bacterium]|nr:glycoside hydrolase family 127 protein [Clostridia bacterium]